MGRTGAINPKPVPVNFNPEPHTPGPHPLTTAADGLPEIYVPRVVVDLSTLLSCHDAGAQIRGLKGYATSRNEGFSIAA